MEKEGRRRGAKKDISRETDGRRKGGDTKGETERQGRDRRGKMILSIQCVTLLPMATVLQCTGHIHLAPSMSDDRGSSGVSGWLSHFHRETHLPGRQRVGGASMAA